jgi:serine/threonine-protein kinase
MPPEQARGKPVDKRADIWAFGVVLYEMLTGERLFEGETVSDTLIEVATKEPAYERVPAKVRRLLRRCLQKDPKKRLRDIGDAWELLEDVPQAGVVNRTPSRSRLGTVASMIAAALTMALVIAGWALWRATRPVDRPLERLDVDLGPEVALPPLSKNGLALVGNVAVSPDGTRLVYVSGNPTRLYTRRLDQSKANELPGTEGASSPFFSPDGQWVGFFTGSNPNKLNKISVEGGAVVPLADIGLSQGGSWGADGNIIVGHAYIQGLVRVPASGGAPTPALDLAPGEFAYTYPQILPGSKAVLFAAYRGPDANGASIEVVSLADRRRKTLVRGATSARYLPSGHLIYTIKGTLFAIRFDPDRLETRGTAVPVLDDVAYQAQFGFVDVDFSQTGTLVYRRGGSGGSVMLTIQWVDGTGKRETLRAKPGTYVTTRLFSGGTRQAFLVTEGESQDVWLYDLQRDSMTRLTFGSGPYYSPNGSPDGQYVVFGSRKGMYWTRADGAGQPQSLTNTTKPQIPRSFTPDGKRLAYTEAEAGGTAGTLQIWTVPLEDRDGQLKAGKPEQFLRSEFFDTEPAFSPDGRWIAYQSNESGKNEVYVRAFPAAASGHAGKWQISNSGGGVPLWSRNGRELVYRAGDQLMAVSYSVNGESFIAEKPRVWIEKLGGIDGPPNYDLSPDGKRVAVLAPVESTDASKPEHEVVLLENFFDELRRRVPVGK